MSARSMLLLIAGDEPLTDSLVTEYRSCVRLHDWVRVDAYTLALRIAPIPRGARHPLAELGRSNGIDHALLSEGRALESFGLLLCDMDSTLIRMECIDELALRKGCADAVTALTEKAMSGQDPDYDRSLRERVRMLAGLAGHELDWVRAHCMSLNPGVAALIAAAHHAGLVTGIVSGGFTYFTQALRRELDMSFAYGNTLVLEGGTVTGELSGPLINARRKAVLLEKLCRQHGLSPKQVIAVGDGANDLEMMALAGLAAAFRPKAIVAAFADLVLWHSFDGLERLLAASKHVESVL